MNHNARLSFPDCSRVPRKAARVFALFLVWPFPSSLALHQERIIAALERGKCTFRVEADDEAMSLRLRTSPENPGCGYSPETARSLLRKAFETTDPPRPEGTYSSLYIGRLIDFPWLCEYLASAAYADKGWDRVKGIPVSMGVNKYVAALLFRQEATAEVRKAIEGSGYRITSVTVEKVLVGSFRDVPQYKGRILPGKVPFDAMVWYRLEKR
jgi:hypothetical protein